MPQLRQEWPLVLFTTLAPAGAGAGVLLSSTFRQYTLDPLIFPASLALFGTIAAGFLISSVHVGRKARMPRAVFNIFRSWLSREIFLLSGSCALFLAAALMYFFRDKYAIEPRFINYAFWLATAAGLTGLFSMQRVYLLRSVRLWTRSRAVSMVFSTALLLGSMEAVLILHLFAGKSIVDMLWRFIPFFIAPLFFDVLQLYELKSIGRKSVVVLFVLFRLVVYLTVFQLIGYVDIVRFGTAMGAAFVGDIILRLFFFSEQTTSFQTELDRARRRRIMPSRLGAVAHLGMLGQKRERT